MKKFSLFNKIAFSVMCVFSVGGMVTATAINTNQRSYKEAQASSYYTITLNANGGYVPYAGTHTTFYYQLSDQKFYDHLHAKTGEPTGEITLSTEFNAHMRTGYTLQGYYTAASGGSLRCKARVATNWNYYSLDQNFFDNKPTGDMTLYAHWTARKFTVNLDKQGGTGGSSSIQATYDSAMPAITLPTKTGYNFDGYYYHESSGNTKYYNANGTSAKNWDRDPDITVSLYAHWSAATYTVTFNHQGGTSSLTTKTATYNAAMPSISSSQLPTRTAYRFDGYYDAAEGGTKYYNANGSSARTCNKTANFTLYAHWTLLSFTVTLNQQNGTGGIPSVTATYGQDMPTIDEGDLPTRVGATFGGYYAQTKGQGTQYYTEAGASAHTWDKTAAATIYAYWIPGDEAQAVIDLIDAIGTVAYPDSGEAITTARDAYDALSEALQSIVNDYNYSTLTAAETEYLTQRNNQIAAVENEINSLPEITTSNFVTDKPLVTTARDHYEALTDEQKELFNADVLALLEEKENTISEMEEEKAAGLAVKDLIAALGDISYPTSKEKLDEAQAAYDALPTTHNNHAQSYVGNYDDLLAAWNAYNGDMNDQISDVENEINALPEITIANFESDKPLVTTARSHYNALTDEQKGLFDTDVLASLVAKEEAIKKYEDEKAAGLAVKALINEIGEVSYPESGNDIKAARDAYEALKNDHEKSYVDNLDVLIAAEAKYEELKVKGADAVKALIDAIGDVEYTDACKGKIDAARAAYDALTAEQKELVGQDKYKVLTDAEELYAKLKVDHDAADAVKALINAIGEVEYSEECKDKIDAARTAYDALTNDQKALIDEPTLTILTNDENAYAKLKADHDAADAVKALIDAIGKVEYTDACKGKIDAARTAYDALTEDQKELVTNKKVLFDDIELYNTLAHQPTVVDNGVAVEGKDGELIPVNVTVKVEVKTSVQAQEGTTEYKNIQELVGNNQKIIGVYDVKLMRTVGDVVTEIQPSDIKPGMIIIVEITLPDGLEVEGLKVLHIHSENDISYVENFKIDAGKLTFETDRLSEIAFVTPAPNALPGWAIALIAIGGLLLLCCLFFLVMFLFFPVYYVDYTKREVRRAINIKKHFDMVLMLNTHFKFVRRNEVDVYKTAEEARSVLA